MLLSDSEIDLRLKRGRLEIEPFVGYGHKDHGKPGVVSFGLTSAGYDLRLGDRFRVATLASLVVSPKRPPTVTDAFATTQGRRVGENGLVIYPGSFILASSLERLRIPSDLVGICMGKSTWARCGIYLNTTPLEPGWEGHVTLEIANLSPSPVELYIGEGICQVQFYETKDVARDYAGKAGIYQAQDGPTLPRVKGVL